MEAKVGKYGVWLSDGDMNIIEKSLEWLENSSYVFNETSKTFVSRDLSYDKIL